MRDIRDDLQDRANMIKRQINDEHAQFEKLILQVKRERDSGVEGLAGQLEAVNRLIKVAAWQYDVRAVVALAAAVTGAVELSLVSTVRHFCHPQN